MCELRVRRTSQRSPDELRQRQYGGRAAHDHRRDRADQRGLRARLRQRRPQPLDRAGEVERRIGDIFERDAAVFLVPTGTAANALALAHLAPPWGAVLCHARAHIATDECGAPEFFGGGLKLIGLPGDGCKLAVDTVRAAIARHSGHRPHFVQPAALSLSQVSEAGTIYSLAEIEALAGVAHAAGLGVHMDGARFANALVRSNASPAAMTWQAGVDALSFGATKGGVLAAEAVVIFDRAKADAMHERRKRGGHLVSRSEERRVGKECRSRWSPYH